MTREVFLKASKLYEQLDIVDENLHEVRSVSLRAGEVYSVVIEGVGASVKLSATDRLVSIILGTVEGKLEHSRAVLLEELEKL